MDPHWASPLLCWSPRLPLLPQLPPCYHDYLELPLILLLNTNTTTHTNTNTQDTRLPRASSCSARAAHKQSHTQCRTPTSIVPNNKYLSLRLDFYKGKLLFIWFIWLNRGGQTFYWTGCSSGWATNSYGRKSALQSTMYFIWIPVLDSKSSLKFFLTFTFLQCWFYVCSYRVKVKW